MVRYEDLKLIAETRLKEAKVLYKNGHYDGSAYICGYVVETALKAKICKTLKIDEYPDEGKDKNIFSSHDFDRLLLLAGLQKSLSLTNKKNKKLFENWSLLTAWKPNRRYTVNEYTENDVKELIKALENRNNGFLPWIRKIW